ncbi:hypothetical protein FCV25MIE_28952, partial [Fagus crenata]
ELLVGVGVVLPWHAFVGSDLFWGAAGDWCGDQVREIEMWLGRGKGFGLVTFRFVAVIGLEGAFDNGTI